MVVYTVAVLLVRSIFKTNVSQSCVARCFRCGGNYNDHCIANLLLKVTVKKYINNYPKTMDKSLCECFLTYAVS